MDDEGFRILAVTACSFDERRFLQAIEPELKAYYKELAHLPVPSRLLAVVTNHSTGPGCLQLGPLTRPGSRHDEPNHRNRLISDCERPSLAPSDFVGTTRGY